MLIRLMSPVLFFALASSAFATSPTPPAASAPHTATNAKVEKLTFTNKMVDGKKTWLPADAKVPAGSKVEITLVNTLDDPHGFTAPGLTTDPVIVGGKETKTFTVQAQNKGDYKFSCQMHPAHVGGQISVQ